MRGSKRVMSRAADPRDEHVPVAVMIGHGEPDTGEATSEAVAWDMTVVDEQLSISARTNGVPGTAVWPRMGVGWPSGDLAGRRFT